MGLDEEFKDNNGLRGTRAHSVERVRAGIRKVDGQIKLFPTAVELSNLLQWCLGGTPTGTPIVTYPLADTLQSRFIQIDKAAKVATYSGCYADKFSIRGSQGEPLDIEIDVVGQDETIGNAGTFPALNLDLANTPFMFFDAAITVNAVTYFARDFSVTVDNALDRNRFYNSVTLTAVAPTDRHVAVNLTLPAGDAWAAYGLGAGGVQVVATFTNGGAVLTLTFPKVTFPRKPIAVDRPEIMIPLPGVAYKSGTATLELTATLNVGP